MVTWSSFIGAWGGTPVSVHYRELLTRSSGEDSEHVPAHLPIGSEVTACLRNFDDELIVVVSRVESAPYGPRGDYWEVTVNGVVPADEDASLNGRHAYPPSLPYLAFLVQQHLRAVERCALAPVIPLYRKSA